LEYPPLFAELSRFLSRDEGGVLCVTGRWGVGKTFAWNKALKLAKQEARLVASDYSYVSLFGLNSIGEVKSAIIDNRVDTSAASTEPTGLSVEKTIKAGKNLFTAAFPWVRVAPQAADYVGLVDRLIFATARGWLVCFDDLERAGTGLSASDLLGFANLLKEQKACKIVLLLNEDALPAEAKEAFWRQIEKVADVIIEFSTSPAVAAEIGLSPRPFKDQISQKVQRLSITNIRIIRRIEDFIDRFCEILSECDARILTQLIETTTLAVYAKLDATSAISIADLLSANEYDQFMNKDLADGDIGKSSLMRAFGFGHADDLDRVVLAAVDTGVVDAEKLLFTVGEATKKLVQGDKGNEVRRAWKRYRNSFERDEKEVLDSMFEAALQNLEALNARDVDACISFLREFGRRRDANTVLKTYLELLDRAAEEIDPELLFDGFHGVGDLQSQDLVSALQSRLVARKDASFDFERALVAVTEGNGWEGDVMARLAAHKVDDFYAAFKNLRSQGAIAFSRISGDDSDVREVGRLSVLALRSIAAESKMNQRRLRDLGLPPQ
jgi:hypothetical protein